MSNMKALSQRVKKLWAMLKFCVFTKVGQGQGQQVINFSMHGKILSQPIHISNMKALSQRVQKLWSMLKFCDRQTHKQTEQKQYAPLFLKGGIKIAFEPH